MINIKNSLIAASCVALAGCSPQKLPQPTQPDVQNASQDYSDRSEPVKIRNAPRQDADVQYGYVAGIPDCSVWLKDHVSGTEHSHKSALCPQGVLDWVADRKKELGAKTAKNIGFYPEDGDKLCFTEHRYSDGSYMYSNTKCSSYAPYHPDYAPRIVVAVSDNSIPERPTQHDEWPEPERRDGNNAALGMAIINGDLPGFR